MMTIIIFFIVGVAIGTLLEDANALMGLSFMFGLMGVLISLLIPVPLERVTAEYSIVVPVNGFYVGAEGKVVTVDNQFLSVQSPAIKVGDILEAPYIKKETVRYKRSVWSLKGVLEGGTSHSLIYASQYREETHK